MNQFADAQTKLVTFFLVTQYSSDSGLASNWTLWLNAIEFMASICTEKDQTLFVKNCVKEL